MHRMKKFTALSLARVLIKSHGISFSQSWQSLPNHSIAKGKETVFRDREQNGSQLVHLMPSLSDDVGRHFRLSRPREEALTVSCDACRFLSRVEIGEIPNHFSDQKIGAKAIERRPIRLQSLRLIVFSKHDAG